MSIVHKFVVVAAGEVIKASWGDKVKFKQSGYQREGMFTRTRAGIVLTLMDSGNYYTDIEHRVGTPVSKFLFNTYGSTITDIEITNKNGTFKFATAADLTQANPKQIVNYDWERKPGQIVYINDNYILFVNGGHNLVSLKTGEYHTIGDVTNYSCVYDSLASFIESRIKNNEE